MNIAIVAPFEEAVPPLKYGGTELVIYNLITQLVKLGHQVILFGTGDSRVPCKVVPIFPHAIRTVPPFDNDPKARETAKFLGCARIVSQLQNMSFDIIHNHIGWRFLPFAPVFSAPMVTTLHGPLIEPYTSVIFSQPEIKSLPLISISLSQRLGCPGLNFVANVYNGIDPDLFPFSSDHDDYLLFLARFSPEKGAKEAIEIAKATGEKLLLAVKVDQVDRAYFDSCKDLIDGKQIVLVGEVTASQKSQLLERAKALVAPIQWEEPFGLYVVEALATGTPVLGIARGSFPELITHGQNGFLAGSARELIPFVSQISTISRRVCRQSMEGKFTQRLMAQNYLAAYEKVISSASPRPV